MSISNRRLTIACEGGSMRGYLAWDDTLGQRPGVLIAPDFLGLSTRYERRADAVAALGYVGLTFDYFAKPNSPDGPCEAIAWMKDFTANRTVVLARMKSALAALKAQPEVDPARVAAMGYCLGGKCVLDLARCGEAFDGGVVLHGVFDPPPFAGAEVIVPKMLVCHGWDDPLCPPEAAVALAAELSAAKADWQMNAYGHAKHGFTNPSNPAMYDADADRRSWQATQNFLAELWH